MPDGPGLPISCGASRSIATRRHAPGRVKRIFRTLLDRVFYFGGSDVYITLDAPDNTAVAAVVMTVGSSGALASVERICC